VWIGDRNYLFLSTDCRRSTTFDGGQKENTLGFLQFPAYSILSQLSGYRDDFKDVLLHIELYKLNEMLQGNSTTMVKRQFSSLQLSAIFVFYQPRNF